MFRQDLFYKFFGYVQQQQFDIASDAFATFKDMLTNHKILCANFLEKNYDRVRVAFFSFFHCCCRLFLLCYCSLSPVIRGFFCLSFRLFFLSSVHCFLWGGNESILFFC